MMKLWLKKAGIRAVKTMCQTAVATIGTAQVLGDADWKMVVSSAVLAGILSLLTSAATGLPEIELLDKEYLTVMEQQKERIRNGEFAGADYTAEGGNEDGEI